MNITFHGPSNFNSISRDELFELRCLTNNSAVDKRDYDDRHIPVNSMFQLLIDNRLYWNETFKNTYVIRAFFHKRVVGWTLYEFFSYGETRAGFYVHHDHRRNGIGSMLLSKVKDESNNFFCGRRGRLVVQPWNAIGDAFFTKNDVSFLR